MTTTYRFHLPDMSCGHCVATITEAARALDPQAQLSFERESRHLQVQTELPRQAWVKALGEAGYEPAGA
jgi:copper chaperone